MSQQKPDDKIEVEIELDEMDLTSAETVSGGEGKGDKGCAGLFSDGVKYEKFIEKL